MPRPKLDTKSETIRVQLVTTAKWLARVTRWGQKQSPALNTSGSIRRLVEAGLEAEKKGRKK